MNIIYNGISLPATSSRPDLEARYFRNATPDACRAAADEIHERLVRLGISFEGRRLPVSLRPSLLSRSEVSRTAKDLMTVRAVMNRMLGALAFDIRSGQACTPLTRFFGHYERWFDLIGGECRTAPHIMLMRFDAVHARPDGFKVMEPNAACPGGVIHCAFIRDAWRNTDLGKAVLDGVEITEGACDSPDGFLRLLRSVSRKRTNSRIALCNYKGVFTNELESLKRRSERSCAVDAACAEIIICDIRDVAVSDGTAFACGKPVDVIYNKVDQLMIDPADTAVAGWIEASRIGSCEFLNSMAALYIGEAKSAFAAIHDDEIQKEIGMSEAERQAVLRRIPRTRMMHGRPSSPTSAELARDRHGLVAKADALTRGSGVHVGCLKTAEDWDNALFGLSQANAVIQDVLNVPHREVVACPAASGDVVGSLATEYWGTDFFFYGNAFGGVVGRSHSTMVFNVGNGGQEVPTFLVA